MNLYIYLHEPKPTAYRDREARSSAQFYEAHPCTFLRGVIKEPSYNLSYNELRYNKTPHRKRQFVRAPDFCKQATVTIFIRNAKLTRRHRDQSSTSNEEDYTLRCGILEKYRRARTTSIPHQLNKSHL